MSRYDYFATCPKGLERLLFDELTALGMSEVHETVAGVSFKGEFTDGLKACLWSRFASRVLLELSEFDAPDDLELYMGAAGIPWEEWFSSSETIAVEFNGVTEEIRNTQYGALKIKDAVCDRLQKTTGSRPDVDRENPDVRIYCHLERRGVASVALDLSGRALLKREYDRHTGAAPLKENLAAAMVARAGYTSGSFLDPMCGSGTLLIEAAARITDTAPGLKRRSYGFYKLKQFDGPVWQELLNDAAERSRKGLAACQEQGVRIAGFDRDPRMVEKCRENLERAGFASLSVIDCAAVEDLRNPFEQGTSVTVVTNPPYGKRMGNFNELIALYGALGDGLKRHFRGARAAVISTSAELLSCLKLHSERTYKLYNGELECQLRVFEINQSDEITPREERIAETATDFKNRLKKNVTHLRKWAQTVGTDAYRVYDADVPEYAAAIDCYGDYYVIQAYSPKEKVNERVHRRRVLDMIAATVEVTGVSGDHVILKSREIQRGDSQYEKSDEQKHEFMTVAEGDLKFRVNLHDYLDTGLFLDARLIRERIMKLAADKDFLNLFCYTSSVSVAAASGGAKSTLGVDMSRTYLEWARANLDLNGCDAAKNRLLQADVMAYIAQDHEERFDLIYVDPPTFSNSKRMQGSFDVRRDHVRLLSNLTRLLKDEGTVVFCNNCRGFRLDEELSAYGFECEDISAATLPRDFRRDEKIHHCYLLKFDRARMTAEPEKLEAAAAPRWQREVGEIRGEARGDDRGARRYEGHGRKRDGDVRGSRGGDGRHGFRGDDRNAGKHEGGYAGKGAGRPWQRDGRRDDKRDFRDERKGYRSDRSDRGDRHDERDDRSRTRPTGRVWGPDGVKDL